MFTSCEAQIENSKTATATVYGNCGMCKKTIEKAGNESAISSVEWSPKTKQATITYDSKQTSLDKVLQRIAKSGYDSENHKAPADVYAALPGCCQYDRPE